MRLLRLIVLFYAGMVAKQPGVPHAELAIQAATAMEQSEPLFQDDRLSVAVVLATMLEESSFRTGIDGDGGSSHGVMQLWGKPGLSVIENVQGGIEQLRISFNTCHDAPYAAYLAGPRGCKVPRVRRLSRHREATTVQILAGLP